MHYTYVVKRKCTKLIGYHKLLAIGKFLRNGEITLTRRQQKLCLGETKNSWFMTINESILFSGVRRFYKWKEPRQMKGKGCCETFVTNCLNISKLLFCSLHIGRKWWFSLIFTFGNCQRSRFYFRKAILWINGSGKPKVSLPIRQKVTWNEALNL